MATKNFWVKVLMGMSTLTFLAACTATRTTESNASETSMGMPLNKTAQKRDSIPEYPEALESKTEPAKRLEKSQTAMRGKQDSREAAGISSWNINGAIAVRGKAKAWTAAVHWAQQGQSAYQIRLMGPIGSGTVLIQKEGSIVHFKDGAKQASSVNADTLLAQQTGIRLPVSHLYYWVRGLPAPGAVQSAQRDGAHNLILLRQAGYTIQFGGYTAASKAALPTHIRLEGQGVAIKLVIKKWQV